MAPIQGPCPGLGLLPSLLGDWPPPCSVWATSQIPVMRGPLSALPKLTLCSEPLAQDFLHTLPTGRRRHTDVRWSLSEWDDPEKAPPGPTSVCPAVQLTVVLLASCDSSHLV